ncbi:MAG: UbiA family prenyltransferase [Dehalococcoidales bacterium]|jgi:protoheme IX farnesyltransferase
MNINQAGAATGASPALSVKKGRSLGAWWYYIEVLKPLPTVLLGFIGLATAVIAGGNIVSWKLLLVLAAVITAAAGANGLTNYLDRDIDARMRRTCLRALPSRAISPSNKVIPLIGGLIVVGLGLSWLLNPYVFLADAGGTLVAATWRKKVTCVYPQGMLASFAPLLMGWLAVNKSLSWELLLLCVLIAAWLPLHVWSVNITHRDDYKQAGINYFPINLEVKDAVKVLLAFALVLYAASLALYFVGHFGWLYLALANVLGVLMVYGSARLVFTRAAADAWKLYRLSAFPYLGLLFLVMCLDIRFLA